MKEETPPQPPAKVKPKRPLSPALKRMLARRQTSKVRKALERARKDGVVV